MTGLEAVSVAAVLLLSLFGCACLFERLAEKLLFPKRSCAEFRLFLEGDREDAENHIRAAQWLSKRYGLPLLVVLHEETDDQTVAVAQRLIQQGVGDLIYEKPPK